MTRETAINLLDNLIGMVEDNQQGDYDEAFKLAIRSLKSWDEDVTSVVHGEWIKMDKRGKNVQCSKCGNTLDLRGVNAGRGDANYCPNCGTKMDDNDSIPFNARWEIDERELGGYDS